MDEAIKRELLHIVGEENFSDALIDLIAYAYDGGEHSHRPEAAVWPRTTEQVSAVMKIANQHLIPVTPRGAGTGICGSAVPIKGGLVLDLSRMNKILEISIEDRLVVLQPGVVYADLQKALDPHGFAFPPDPGSTSVCTIGGNVATNAGGIRGAKYGTTKDYVLGLQVVLADGRVMRTGSKTMKTASGLDLTRLFVGSEGALGVVTEITLKITPKPLAAATLMGLFDDLEDAARSVSQVMSSGIIPSVMEIMGRHLLEAINDNTDLDLPVVETMLLVETDGFTQTEADFQMERVIEIFKRNNAVEIKRAETEAEAAELWAARKSAYPVVARLNNDVIVEDVTVPIAKLPDLIRGFSRLVEKYDLTVATCAHAGDGNFHPLIAFDAKNEVEAERVHAAVEELFKLAMELNGTLTGEHGIGLSKAKYMALEHDEVEMSMMRAIKTAFDPNNILNPGKQSFS